MLAPEGTWQTAETDALLDAIVGLRDRDEAAHFLRDLCTLGELHDLAQRWQVARLLAEGRHYGEVSRLTGASTATVTRIAQWLHHGTGGYARALERLAESQGLPSPMPAAGSPDAPGPRPVEPAGSTLARRP
ncbi:MAG: YerC/YecD family TrpR-related protein [Candidatus Limnocylindrales bacterium]|jgi:TrpR-related protein YerC/YecD